jgi:photosystem II stability/assembly factor-like uncharacterized protein
MRIWNDQIAILAQRTGSNIGTVVYFWDGASATYNEVIGVNEAQPMAIFPYLGSLLLFGLNGRIYEYRGISADGLSDFQIIADVPGTPTIKNPSCVIMSDGLVLFGVLGVSSNSIGVWAYGRLPVTNSVALFQKYTPKGDFKYDDGVTDYYSVTSLFNLRVDDSVFNPSASGTADTVTSDSTAGDSTWTTITRLAQPAFSINTVACDTDGSVVVLGTGGHTYISTDSGATFTDKAVSADNGLATDSDGSVILIAQAGTDSMYLSTNSGSSFAATGSSRSWYTATCDDDGSVLVGTYQSTSIDYSTNTGSSWSTVAVGGSGTVNDVCVSSTGATMYAGCTGSGVGAIRKSTNTGSTWANAGDAGMDDIIKVSCSSDGAVVVAASPTDNALWLSTNSGTAWSQVSGLPSGVDVDTVSISAAGTKIIVGLLTGDNAQSYVMYSDDQGANWSWLGDITYTGTANLHAQGLVMSRDGTKAYVTTDNNSDNNYFWRIAPVAAADVALDDNTYVVTGSKETNLTSFYLKALDFDFAVSTGNTVTGIAVKVTMKKQTGTTAKDVLVKLVKAGSIVGDNKGADTDRSTSETEYTYGSTVDLWGTTWTDAQINATDFGCVIQAKNTAAVMAIEKIQIVVYWDPPATLPVQQEYLYAAVQRGNTTGITETMKTGIVSLKEAGFTEANLITTGEDFELPANMKRIYAIAAQTYKPLVGGETITCYVTSDDTSARELKDITWTEVCSWAVGEENLMKYLTTPLTARRVRWKFEITPQTGSPETAPGLIGYTVNYEPLKLFSNT